ncbi:MAG: Phosphatidylinositol 3-kinase catalytic subunit type 3 [Marteilia pararefringens]
MENLMLKENGQFFHIDFSFILGQDPKPWPAPMRLNSFMINGMGGLGSKHFLQFSRYIYLSFMCLQRASQTLLSSFDQLSSNICSHLMPMSSIEALEKIESNLHLGKSEEESTRYIESIVKKSIAAVMPEIMEKFHNFAQLWTG